MPVFSYQAVDSGGRTKRGVIEAQSMATARRALREKKLLPVSVTASARGSATGKATGEARSLDGLLARLRRSRPSGRDLSTATRQLSTLIGSDVRIEEALRLLAAQDHKPALTETLLDVRANVLEGSSFARALAQHPSVFPDFYVASIHAGEQSSRLSEVLVYLADFVEARHAASRKLKLALLYPALLATISALIMTLMMIYVVPDIVEVFVSRGADLPFLTRLLIASSQFLNSYGLVLLALIALAAFLGLRQFARPEVRLAFDRMLATRRPFMKFSRQINAARFAATLATLVQSAV
ncbi:MAG: type II secretion system F family protein, partial [Alteraurantiacibacter sp.]